MGRSRRRQTSKSFLRLALNALGAVDHHHGGVDRRQRAIGVLGEVLVARRVDEVEELAAPFERHCSRRNGDAAVLLHLHEVRARPPRLALGAHLAGLLDRAAEEQQLFRERRLSRIGMRDDRKRPSPRDFRRQGGVMAEIWRVRRHGEGGRGSGRGREGGGRQSRRPVAQTPRVLPSSPRRSFSQTQPLTKRSRGVSRCRARARPRGGRDLLLRPLRRSEETEHSKSSCDECGERPPGRDMPDGRRRCAERFPHRSAARARLGEIIRE